MTEDDAERYHTMQATTFRDTEADMVTAITMTYAAGHRSHTGGASSGYARGDLVYRRNRWPPADRQTLQEAIEQVDDATGRGPAYYMINCAHPTHFVGTLAAGEPWLDRILV